MQAVEAPSRQVDEYARFAGPDAIDQLRHSAEPLRGARILHVNATRNGGGVAEILRSMVPILRDLGLVCDWRVLDGSPPFFEVTKQMHNRLQGGDGRMTQAEGRVWSEWQQRNAETLGGEYDIVVVHDPQPAGLGRHAGHVGRHWIWRLHIDTSRPHPGVWTFLLPYLDAFDLLVFTLPEFVPTEVHSEQVRVMAPAIDPLSPKNRPIPLGRAQDIVAGLGIDLARPLIAQVSRLDPWKDPLGVIEAFHMARAEHPGLQLALVGAMDADDDPEAERIAAEVMAHADHPDIHVFTDPARIGPVEVGAVQLLAAVILQKSVREGFGLTVSEALWKGTPVVGGRAGGIPLQLEDGHGGYLVDSTQDAARRCIELLEDPPSARAIGAAGRVVVQRRFLITRLVAEELALYSELLRPASRPSSPPVAADMPVA